MKKALISVILTICIIPVFAQTTTTDSQNSILRKYLSKAVNDSLVSIIMKDLNDSNLWTNNKNLRAMKPLTNKLAEIRTDNQDQMPCLVPTENCKMPVYKPLQSVKYSMLIKKPDNTD